MAFNPRVARHGNIGRNIPYIEIDVALMGHVLELVVSVSYIYCAHASGLISPKTFCLPPRSISLHSTCQL